MKYKWLIVFKDGKYIIAEQWDMFSLINDMNEQCLPVDEIISIIRVEET